MTQEERSAEVMKRVREIQKNNQPKYINEVAMPGCKAQDVDKEELETGSE